MDIAEIGYRIDRSGIDKAERSLQRLDRQFNAVNKSSHIKPAGFNDYNRSVGTATNKTAGFATSLRGIGVLLPALSLATVGQAIVSNAVALEDALLDVQGKLGATATEMVALEDAAKKMGATTRFSAGEAASAMQFLAQAGLEQNQIITALPEVLNLASAANLSLAESADMATNALGIFGLETTELSRVNDVLVNAANSSNVSVSELYQTLKVAGSTATGAGLSIEEVAAAAGALGNKGLKGAEAGTALRNVMSILANPAGDAAKALAELGLSSESFYQTTEDGRKVMIGLPEAMDAIAEKTNDATFYTRIFGAENGNAAYSLATATTEAYKLEEAVSKQGSAAEVAALKSSGMTGAFNRLTSTAQATGQELFDTANSSETLIGVMDGLTNVIGGLPAIFEAVAGYASAFGDRIDELSLSLSDWLTSVAESDFNKYASKLSTEMTGLGVHAVRGLQLGLQSNKAMIGAATKLLTGEITDTTKAELQIKSPSRVMMQMGGHVGAGLAIGINDSSAGVRSAASGMSKEIVTAVDAVLSSLDAQYIKLTSSDESARRYELAGKKITGSLQDQIIEYEDLIKSLELQEKQQKASNDALSDAQFELDKATTELTSNKDASRKLELQNKKTEDGTQLLTDAVIDEIIALEDDTKAAKDNIAKKEDFAKAQKAATDAVRDSEQDLEIATKSIWLNDEAVRALTLSYEDGYTPALADAQAKNEAATKAAGDYRRQLIDVNKAIDAQAEKQYLQNIELTEGAAAAESARLMMQGYSEAQATNFVQTESNLALQRDFYDVLVDGIANADSVKDVFDSLGDWLETWLRQQIATFAANKIMTYVGVGGGGMPAIGGGGAGSTGIMGTLSGPIMAGGIGYMAGNALGAANPEAMGALSGLGMAIAGPVGAVIGGIIGSAFGGSKQQVGSGIEVGYSTEGGVTGRSYDKFEKEKSLWRGTRKWEEYSDLDSDVEGSVDDYFSNLNRVISTQAEIFGVAASDEILNSFSVDTQKFEGANAEKELEKWLIDSTKSAYQGAAKELDIGIRQAIKDGVNVDSIYSTTEEIAARFDYVAQVASNVTPALQGMGMNISDVFDQAVLESTRLVDSMGGVEIATQQIGFAFNNLAPASEQFTSNFNTVGAAVGEFNAAMGLSGSATITTTSQLWDYIQSQDLSTTAGREAAAAAYEVAGSMVAFDSAIRGVNSMFAETIANIELDLLTQQEKQKKYMNEAEKLFNDLKAESDPGKIAEMSERINASVNSAWANMTREQKEANSDYLINMLEASSTFAAESLESAIDSGEIISEAAAELDDPVAIISSASDSFASSAAVGEVTASVASEAAALFSDTTKEALNNTADEIKNTADFGSHVSNFGRIASSLFNDIADRNRLAATSTAGEESIASGLPAFATGGAYGGGLALVGEQGPELINFNQRGYVYDANQTKDMLSGSSNSDLLQRVDRLITLNESALQQRNALIAENTRLNRLVYDSNRDNNRVNRV